MSEQYDDRPPSPVSLDDLRYTRIASEEPGGFEILALEHGWDVSVQEEMEDQPLEARYVMAREVHRAFNDTDLMEAQELIGIVDESGEIYEGYALYVQRIGDEIEFDEDFPLSYVTETNRLIFDYQGYPDEGTMKVLERVAKYKPPRPLNWWGKVLIYFGMQKHRKNQPYTWDYYKKR